MQGDQKLERDVERSLDRLQMLSSGAQVECLIPAFYYSADLLLRYAQTFGVNKINESFFRAFNKEMEIFNKIDYQNIKQHEKEIIEEMLEIVDSAIFIECMREDIRTSRSMIRDSVLEDEECIPPSTDKMPLNASIKIKNSFVEEDEKEESETSSIVDGKVGTKSNLEELWESLVTAYKEHRIDEANDLKEEILEKKYPLKAEHKELFETISLQYKTMMEFYVQFDQEGWVFDKEEDGVTLEYKIFEEEKQIAIRIESEFDVPVENFLAILCEMELFGTYVPFCYDSREEKVISRNEKIGSSKIYIPLLKDRETFFYAAGYDRVKHNGSVFLYSKTINEDTVYQKKYGFDVPPETDYVRLQYKFFIVEYIPITRSRARVRLASRIDMKLNFLPQWILNTSARKFAFNYFKNIIKVNKKFAGSKWEKKIEENPQFYMFFKKKITQYLE